MKTHLLRPRNVGAWAALLVALLATLLMPACKTTEKPSSMETAEAKVDDLKVELRGVVRDEGRAAKVVDLLDDMVALLTKHNRDLAAQDAQITAMITNYDTTAEDLRTAFAKFSAVRAGHSSRAIMLLEQMRASTTPEEWAELRKSRQKTMKAVMNAARPN